MAILFQMFPTFWMFSVVETFAKLNLACGYWQAPVNPQYKEKTAFVTHLGLLYNLRLPFGLKTDPQFFQQILNTILPTFCTNGSSISTAPSRGRIFFLRRSLTMSLSYNVLLNLVSNLSHLNVSFYLKIWIFLLIVSLQ